MAHSWDRDGAAASHDGKVEGVVVKDDAVLEFCVRGRARYAQARFRLCSLVSFCFIIVKIVVRLLCFR